MNPLKLLWGITLSLSNDGHLAISVNLTVKALLRRELKFTAHSSSPLKWTKTIPESSEEDFSYETGVFNP
ncbi:hypothetical protein [Merismopedia glauca]|uniref:hypothetical protein n=1 Tax=Merismopedia glauca TaxID=292586 RepID=UPI0011B29764|nr:hypothetical protein [Merismopedia glauca]